jgi:hypothetical protein
VVSPFVLKEYNGACQSHAAMRRGGAPAAMPSFGRQGDSPGIRGVVDDDVYGARALKQGVNLTAEQQLKELGVSIGARERGPPRQPLCLSK